jgi:hypothetical protein
MPRKKEINLEEKFLLPRNDQLLSFLKDYKEPALTPSTIAGLQKRSFTSLWEHTNREALIIFTRWLLECPIFIQDKHGIRLRDPGLRTIPRQKITPKNVLYLLWGLSGELANFSLSNELELRNCYELLRKPLSLVKDLKSYKRKLISLGIVKKEDKFDKVYASTGEWMVKLKNLLLEGMPPIKKEELIAVLYPYFKKLTRLPDITIYKFISHIMKHLGVEKGDVNKIAEAMEKRLRRKGIKKELVKKTLNLDRLRKTLIYLTHLPL